MTFLLYLLLIIFLLIEVPLISLVIYLLRFPDGHSGIRDLRRVILVLVFSQIIFTLENILLVVTGIFHLTNIQTFLIATYSSSAIIVFVANWWSFFEIRKLL